VDFPVKYPQTSPGFTIKFARSPDLLNWEKIPDALFGTNRYTACPSLHYQHGWYYMLYLEQRKPRWLFETYITRSKDLKQWFTSPANPVLQAQDLDEGINASDPEVIEYKNNTYIYFAVGDQRTWMNVKRARFPGAISQFFKAWYKQPGIPDPGTLKIPSGP